jgi:hypothetical protein
MPFDYRLDFAHIDFREHPELYRVGVGEQGVLVVEPYKSEILPDWRFKTEAIARESADAIYAHFLKYKADGDFVGMDMARKFLQMGYTRARRYANHPSGKKYAVNPQKESTESTEEKEKTARLKTLPQSKDWADSEKARAAKVFYESYRKAHDDPDYQTRKQAHMAHYGR